MRPEREEDFVQAIIEAAQWFGWRVHHQRPARIAHGWRSTIQGDPGWPDLALAKAGHPLILAETKSAVGRVSASQALWLEVLSQARGQMAVVWHPADWETIVSILSSQRRRPHEESKGDET